MKAVPHPANGPDEKVHAEDHIINASSHIMRINPKSIATLYLSSWWLPFVGAFCMLVAFVVLSVVIMAFTFRNYLGLM